jgi:hypothetical protein
MMSKAVVCTGREDEFKEDVEVTHVTVADGVTEIKEGTFWGCKSLTNLGFLKGSTVTTVGVRAFLRSGIITLLGMEGVRKLGNGAFAGCKDLRTIEGLGCEEMGGSCFLGCGLLLSMKGWPASMTVIPAFCFRECTGMTTVDCDLSSVTSIGVYPWGGHAFAGCTSLLPPSLSKGDADPAAVLTYLKRKSKDERMAARYSIYASVLVARKQEGRRVAERRRASPLASAMALLPKEMAREIVEFAHGVVVQR